MPYKIPQSKVTARMSREVAVKHSQLALLQQEHSSLLFQHSLLTETCELLQWLRSQHLSHVVTDIDQLAAESSNGADSRTLAHEQELLQRLQQLRCCNVDAGQPSNASIGNPAAKGAESAVATAAASAAACTAGAPIEAIAGGFNLSCSSSSSSSNSSSSFARNACHISGSVTLAPSSQHPNTALERQPPSLYATLSPPDDAMQLFRRLFVQPRQWEHITLQQMQQDYATTVCELSLNLAMLEQPQLQARCCAEHPAAVCERLVVRHFHQLASLLLLRRNDLVMAFYLSNCLSGYVGEGMSKEALACVVQQMLLTPHQQQRIADGEALFKRLLAPVIRARQQLQGSGFGSASGHTEGGCAGGAAAPAACLDGFPARTDALHQQQVKVANLTTLMKKELFLKACLTGFCLGCLTLSQATRLLIQTFPHPPPVAAISQEIALQWKERSAQQQQQAADALLQKQQQPLRKPGRKKR